jgi:spermidine synthase
LLYAYETADAVEEQEFLVNGVPMSDFVYPAWFEEFRKSGSAQFDHMKKVRRPFQILAGGYMPVYRSGRWTEIFGSESKYTRFKKEDRRGHRSTYRGQTEQMKPSRVKGRALGARRRARIEELVH